MTGGGLMLALIISWFRALFDILFNGGGRG
jgi:hypothetical protein